MLNYAILVVAILCGVIGDIFLKRTPGVWNWNMALGCLFFAAGAPIVSYSFKHINLSTIAIMWNVTAIILLSFLGFFVYKEPASLNKIVAIILALIAGILISK